VIKLANMFTVDDADSTRVQQDIQTVAGLGEICVSVFRTLQRDPIVPPLADYRTAQYTPVAEVSEKALKGKAISHGVAYGEQRIVTRYYKETVDVDGSNNPVAVFVFKYRSRGMSCLLILRCHFIKYHIMLQCRISTVLCPVVISCLVAMSSYIITASRIAILCCISMSCQNVMLNCIEI
jgi:hypothetical protein